VDDAVCALEAWPATGPALLVIDDFHALEGTAAEAAFARFVDFAPAWLAPVVATRVAPGLNLTRLRLDGALLELGPDDLRFRPWEVEQLFRDVYHDPVPPADLAVLARRTEGWAGASSCSTSPRTVGRSRSAGGCSAAPAAAAGSSVSTSRRT
jgi:ATP/maltotriose-dependent transcriptional regulator MalT